MTSEQRERLLERIERLLDDEMAAPKDDQQSPVILEPRAVGVPLAAKALGISERSCYDEVRSNRLRHFRYGARVLIPVSALDEWVEAQRSEAS